ncbi:MAG TPA: PEGA domain-containing protein [Vicinamibacterales bacterium]|nr:PEGA domain-containing protein [Vicinamibacterales bacterium]
MTRRRLTLWTAAAALTVSVSPAWAGQAKERPESKPTPDSNGSAASRPSSGDTTGSAVSRPSNDSGSSAGSASSGGSSSSSMPAGGGSSYGAPRAPERRSRGEQGGQNNSADSSRDRAVVRGEQSNAPRGADRVPSADGSRSGAERRAVPAYSRPRDGQQPVGSAVERRGGVPSRGNNGGYSGGSYYDPYYGYGNGYGSRYGYYSGYGYGNYGYANYGHGRWFPAYGFGLGYFYDPFSYGYYSPYDSDYGYGSGGYGGYRDAGRYGRERRVGQLRLKVKPDFGQVYVDGYYVGEVDSFDGAFQRMPIEAGAHRVEIRAAGYQTVGFEVLVNPGETVTYKGELRPIR